MFGKKKAKPEAKANESADRAEQTIGTMLRGAFNMGFNMGRATAPKPVTFNDAAKALALNELERRALEKDAQSLGFDLGKVYRASMIIVERRDLDSAMNNIG